MYHLITPEIMYLQEELQNSFSLSVHSVSVTLWIKTHLIIRLQVQTCLIDKVTLL